MRRESAGSRETKGRVPSNQDFSNYNGLLITSACLNARIVTKNALRILQDYIPDFTPVQREHSTLKDELAELALDEKRFLVIPTGVRGIIFICWFRDPNTPDSNVVVGILRNALAENKSFYPLSRIYPILAVSGHRVPELRRGTRAAVTTYLKSIENADPTCKARYTEDRPLLVNISVRVRNNTDCDSSSIVSEASNSVIEAAQGLGWHISVMLAASDVFLILNVCKTTVYYTMSKNDCKIPFSIQTTQ